MEPGGWAGGVRNCLKCSTSKRGGGLASLGDGLEAFATALNVRLPNGEGGWQGGLL